MIYVCKCLLIEQTFTKWTSSLSLILDSHRFNYLLDDAVHLQHVDFASTQISSIPESKTSILASLPGNFFHLESLVQFEAINSLFLDLLIFVFVNICLVQNLFSSWIG